MQNSVRNRVKQMQSLARGFGKPEHDSASVLRVAQHVWKQLDTPLSLGLSLLVNNGQLKDALGYAFDPRRYQQESVELARDDYQAVAILKKAPLEIEGVDREAAAWEKFLAAEELCRVTNARFRNFDPALHKGNILCAVVLSKAKCKIAAWLGERVNAQSWALRCRFGPGADSLNKGRHVSAYHKLSQLSSTNEFADGARALVRDHPAWHSMQSARTARRLQQRLSKVLKQLDESDPTDHELSELLEDEIRLIHREMASLDVTLVPGNKVTFVPKTALVDRSIAVEPGLNIYAQLGLGALIRQRLKRIGLNLDHQDPNRALAYLGSRDGTVATIDLSSASDTIARELVRWLLPDHWYYCLNWCRSVRGFYTPSNGGVEDRREIVYQKFSSMGNGFTFELESMIFYALALACDEVSGVNQPSVVRAYGDDITCAVGVVPLLTEVLSFCGFLTNPEKTFSSGVFRESCGMDFFAGVNIRPYFLKECQLGDLESLFRVANGLRRVAHRRNRYIGCDRKLRPVWVHVVSRIPRPLRDVVGPAVRQVWTDDILLRFNEDEVPDNFLVVNLDEAMSAPTVRRNSDGWCGWDHFSWVEQGRCETATHWEELYAHALFSCRDGVGDLQQTTVDQLSLRGKGRRLLKPRVFSGDWPDLGSWV